MARPSGSYTKFKSFPAFRSPNLNSTRNGRLRPHQARPPRLPITSTRGACAHMTRTAAAQISAARAARLTPEGAPRFDDPRRVFRGRYVPNRHEMSGRDRIERDAPHPPSILPRARARTTRTPATPISVARAAYLVCPSGSDPRANLARFRGSHPRNTRPTHRPIAMKSHHTAQKCVRTREL